ncbi:MAG TPA: hypothetical protein VF656_13780 [Pyrinomonadaceae bacterium]|jgi:hypothetical protein
MGADGGNPTTGNSNDGETAGLDLLDFLFTLAISIGLSPGILGIDDWPGILSEDWMKSGRLPTRANGELHHFMVFVLGFLTLTLSWFGYHASIKTRPLRYKTAWGMIRFVIDVLLVVTYGLILLQFKNLGFVIFLLFVVHLIFVIWDILKIGEYWKEFQEKRSIENFYNAYRREFISLLCLLYFFGLWLFSHRLSARLLISLAIFFTIFYRIQKMYTLKQLGRKIKSIPQIFKGWNWEKYG